MNRKWNQAKFIARAIEIHGTEKYDYSLVIFDKISVKVEVVCREHGNFWTTPSQHLKGIGCPTCGRLKCDKSRTKDTEWFIKQSLLLYDNKFDYTKVMYVTSLTKVEIICSVHGSFWQTPNAHLRKSGCKKCGIEVRRKKRSFTNDDFVRLSVKRHGYLYNYSLAYYTGNANKVIIICPRHGQFEQTAARHMIGKGCYKCGKNKAAKSKTITQEEFVNRSNIAHKNKYNYDLAIYEHGRKKITIICPTHGQFLQTPEGHLSGRGCRKCCHFISKSETEWLDSIGLPDTSDYRNVTIDVGDRKFRVDGFDFKTNTVYEFYGDYYHGHPDYFKANEVNSRNNQTFGQLYSNTIEREKLIKEAGYTVVTIWEHKYKIMKKAS